jgi:hypothetical protein
LGVALGVDSKARSSPTLRHEASDAVNNRYAYTAGPDEALDPLMLALSATLQLKLTQLTVSTGEAVALLSLGLLLAVLFATRLMLSERDEEDERPKIWWVPDREKKQDKT